jgi:hypothetical protein
MVEKKKVPHLDLTVSLRRQPGAAQLVKKAVKSGRPVNVLAIIKQYEEYFDENGYGEAHLDLFELAVEPAAAVPDFVKRAIDDVYDEEAGPDLLGALQKILGYDYNVTDRYKTKQWLELDQMNGWHFARVLYATTDRAYTIENEDQRYVVLIPNSKRDYEVTIVHKDESGQVRPLTLAIDIIKRYPKRYSMTAEEIRKDAKWAWSEDLMVKVEQFVEEF